MSHNLPVRRYDTLPAAAEVLHSKNNWEKVGDWLIRAGVIGGLIYFVKLMAIQVNPAIGAAIAASPVLNFFFGPSLLPRSAAVALAGGGLKLYGREKSIQDQQGGHKPHSGGGGHGGH